MWEMQALSTTPTPNSTHSTNLDTNNGLISNSCTTSSDENGIGSETDSTSVTDGGVVGVISGGTGGGILSSGNSIINGVSGGCENDATPSNNNTHLVHGYELNCSGGVGGSGGCPGPMHIDVQQHQHSIHVKHARTVGNLLPSAATSAAVSVAIQNDNDTSETVFIDANGSILHPALRGVKAVNIGNYIV